MIAVYFITNNVKFGREKTTEKGISNVILRQFLTMTVCAICDFTIGAQRPRVIPSGFLSH